MDRLCFLFVLIVSFAMSMCTSRNAPIPKPRAYPRIIYPERTSVTFSDETCPFTFEHADYFSLEKKTNFLDQEPTHPCWYDLVSESLNARIHFSYYELNSQNQLDQLVNDAFKIANKINQRANYMDELVVRSQTGASGLILEFKGPAASPMHFFLTDSTKHFLKASLYFDTQVNPDSLAPVIEFVQTDIAQLINSFTWQ